MDWYRISSSERGGEYPARVTRDIPEYSLKRGDAVQRLTCGDVQCGGQPRGHVIAFNGRTGFVTDNELEKR